MEFEVYVNVLFELSHLKVKVDADIENNKFKVISAINEEGEDVLCYIDEENSHSFYYQLQKQFDEVYRNYCDYLAIKENYFA